MAFPDCGECVRTLEGRRTVALEASSEGSVLLVDVRLVESRRTSHLKGVIPV